MLDPNGEENTLILKHGEDMSDAELLHYLRELDSSDEPSLKPSARISVDMVMHARAKLGFC